MTIHSEISNHFPSASIDEPQDINVQQLEDQLERIKQLYMNETKQTVIDKQ